MIQLKQKHLSYICLLLLAIPLYFINIHNTQGWGDDFAQYIKEAQNIATAKPYYQSNYIFNAYNAVYAPPQYPVGFPLLLAPVVKFWGISFTAICYFNSVITTLLLFALFFYFRKKNIGTISAVCLAVMATYSHYVLDLKSSVLADVPCLLFITLYLVCRANASFSWKNILCLILLATMAIQIRSQAIFLLVAEGLFLIISLLKALIYDRKIPLRNPLFLGSGFIIVGTVVLNLILTKIIFSTPVSTTSFYNDFIHTAVKQNLLEIAKEYSIYVFKVISAFFYVESSVGFFNTLGYFIGCAGLVFCITGFFINVSKSVAFDDIFFVIMCFLIIYYPVRDHRYFLPALPILFYYCFISFRIILHAVFPFKSQWIAILVTLLYLRSESVYIKKITDQPLSGSIPQQKDIVAFQYISKHVTDREIIVFTKPRALTLFTNKRCMNAAWQISPQMNKKIFDSMKVKYILVLDGLDDNYFRSYLYGVEHPIDSVKISEGYILYSLR